MPRDRQERVSGWGRQFVPAHERLSEDLERATEGAVLTRGLGRSYGDASLPPKGVKEVAASRLADRILAWDEAQGRIRVEAGFPLHELYRLFLPRGWFTPVTPGTAFVTVGGMVASDVHGKNHHRAGCFGEYVDAVKLKLADGRTLEVTPQREPELFRATLGGMGLTGHILEVAFRLERVPSPWIYQESERVPNIDRFIEGLKEAGPRWPFTVGWIDCLTRGPHMGRGILYKGRWATPDEAPKKFPKPKARITFPFQLPELAMGPWFVRTFAFAYYWKQMPKEKQGIVHPETYFYPLDGIRHWNRAYGPRGLTQHQCVLPEEAGRDVARRYLEVLTKKGGASFLCVIKDCGKEGTGMLSFPRPGISIALDIAVRDDTQELIDTLNEFVIKEGGRIYLTKDAFTRPEHFRAMEPRLREFEAVRRKWDPDHRLKSAQSERLLDAQGKVGS